MHSHPQRHIMTLALLSIVGGIVIYSWYSLPKEINRVSQMGNVISVAASVEPNPYNTIMKQIREKEEKLRTRELALANAITKNENSYGNSSANSYDFVKSAYAFLAVLFGLLFFTHLYFDKKYPLHQA